MLLFRCFVVLVGLVTFSFGQVPTVPSEQPEAAARAKVAEDLRANKLDDALSGAQAILTAHPDSAAANKLVGVVLLAQEKAAEALPYFQKAQRLDAKDFTIPALLLQAYAQSGDAKNRDAERAILREYHSDGKHPEFAHAPSFEIETIPFQGKVVQAQEFFEPEGTFHFYYRFNVFDTSGHLMFFYALQSDDADQAAFAQQHPKEAAAGERRFSIDVYAINAKGHPVQGVVTYLDGQPTYDDLRARIVHVLDTGGQTAAPPAAAAAPQ